METIPGGCYKDAQGDGWHDAHGNPVSKENVEKFLMLTTQQTPDAQADELALLKQQMIDLQAQIQPEALPAVKAKKSK